MAEQSTSSNETSVPRNIPPRSGGQKKAPLASLSLPSHPAKDRLRSGQALDSFSPINQNGSFEFDRVLKNGYVQKRTRKTKAWKQIYLVLRPNFLSIYKDQNEEKLRHKIPLADLTAVALLKDPKHKRQNMFGLFSPARNYHLEASSKEDAEQWVELIRSTARIEEEEEELYLQSPGGNASASFGGFEQAMQKRMKQKQDERLASSSPEPSDPPPRLSALASAMLHPGRRGSHVDYSGNEVGSHSDVSDAEPYMSIGPAPPASIPEEAPSEDALNPAIASIGRDFGATGRNVSQLSGFPTDMDPERIVWQGFLLYLKSKGGVRQWKDLWAVLRPKSLALYKDGSEYSPRLILPLSSIINAVEIDPVSRTKIYCMQIITEEKSYRFCAHSEEELDKSLGAFKSLLAKRKELEGKRAMVHP